MRQPETTFAGQIKSRIPWWAKIVGKLLLSRMPVSYETWANLSLFKHGPMEQPAYAYGTFTTHFARASLPNKPQGFVCLELGPGNSLFSALIAHAFGASRTYCVDSGRFAVSDVGRYRAMLSYLRDAGLPLPELERCTTLTEMMKACDAHYETDGFGSLRALPSDSVDFIWSHAVLEHLRRDHFSATLREMHRVIHPEGISSHRVDLRDHLGGGLNNLRFSESLWETEFMASSGFYTNRIRYSEMLAMFGEAGFDVNVIAIDRWEELPTQRNRMSSEFDRFSNEDLCISGFDVVLTPKGTGRVIQ